MTYYSLTRDGYQEHEESEEIELLRSRAEKAEAEAERLREGFAGLLARRLLIPADLPADLAALLEVRP